MFQTLDVFRLSGAMARHAAERQAVTAVNIANADTPGFRASHLASFRETYRAAETGSLRTTRPAHIPADRAMAAARADRKGAEPAPNGNDVSLELEMVGAVDAQREHSNAMAIYRHALTVLRTTVSR